MRFEICILLASSLAQLASAYDEDMATFSSFGRPLNSGLITTVRHELNNRVNSIWVDHPANTVCGGCLIDHWNHNTGTGVGRRVPLSQLDGAMSGMPAELVNKVKAIVFANKVVFEMFTHTVKTQSPSAHYVHYLGVARRQGDDVELAVLKGDVNGRLVPKQNTIQHRQCRKVLWRKKCKNVTIHVPRGYHAHEISQIETALRAETVRRLRERANDISF